MLHIICRGMCKHVFSKRGGRTVINRIELADKIAEIIKAAGGFDAFDAHICRSQKIRCMVYAVLL